MEYAIPNFVADPIYSDELLDLFTNWSTIYSLWRVEAFSSYPKLTFRDWTCLETALSYTCFEAHSACTRFLGCPLTSTLNLNFPNHHENTSRATRTCCSLRWSSHNHSKSKQTKDEKHFALNRIYSTWGSHIRIGNLACSCNQNHALSFKV